MSNNVLADSYISTGRALAFSEGMSPERMADRSAAYADKEQRDQELRTMRATEPTAQDRAVMSEEQTVALQNALEAQKSMLLETNKQKTYAAYERYDADGDVRHINTMLTDLESTGSKLYGKIARVDKLTEQDRQMLEDTGFDAQLIDEMLNNPDVNKSYVKITQKDGTTSFGDMDVLKGLTGYNDYAATHELERQKAVRETEMIAALGYDPTPLGREAFRRAKAEIGPRGNLDSPEFQEAYTKIYDKLTKDSKRSTARGKTGTGSGGSKRENQTEKEAEAGRRTRKQGYREGDPGWEDAFSTNMSDVVTEFGRTSGTKNIEVAEDAEAELEAEGFWDMDFDALNPSQRGKIEAKIRRIEQLGGDELSPADKTALERIQRLTSYGDAASDLTPEQVGLFDGLFRMAKKYISNDIDGVNAEAAYAGFRNLVKHDLYGASLQPGESANFVSQFGSLLQQHGPVLQQLRTTLTEIRDSYEAIVRTNNPMVIAWRTGKTGSELQDVIDNLDERVEMLDNIAKNKPITTINPPNTAKPATVISPQDRAKLDKIYGKNTGVIDEN